MDDYIVAHLVGHFHYKAVEIQVAGFCAAAPADFLVADCYAVIGYAHKACVFLYGGWQFLFCFCFEFKDFWCGGFWLCRFLCLLRKGGR